LQNKLGNSYHVIEEGLNGRTTVWDDPVRGHYKRQGSSAGINGKTPKILIMAPPVLGRLTEYAETFSGGVEKSGHLARHYAEVTRQHGCKFLDTGAVIRVGALAGLHFDPDAHATLGKRSPKP